MIKTNGVNLYTGVVVNVDDPLKANRVKVRLFGLHDGIDIENKHLSWALVNMPVTGGSVTGIGTNHSLKNGSLVTVYFIDGEEQQIPLVLGSISGIQDKNYEKFFKNDKFPISDRLTEPDVNRIARNENIDKTIIKQKRDTVDKGVTSAFGVTWDEPETEHNSKYPLNQVIETESGHIIELDDTDGAERIHVWHRTGTSIELRADGSVVYRSMNNNYEVINNDNNVHIKGVCNVTIDSDSNLKVNGNTNIETIGDTHVKTNGNTLVETIGDTTVKTNGNTKVDTSGNTDITTGGNMNLTAGGDMKLSATRIDLN